MSIKFNLSTPLPVEKRAIAVKDVSLDRFGTFKTIFFSLIFYFIDFAYRLLLRSDYLDGFRFQDHVALSTFKIRHLGSNHIRRSDFFLTASKSLVFNILRKNTSEIQSSTLSKKEPFFIFKSNYYPVSTNFHRVIFSGDSHVEFLTRVNLSTYGQKKLSPLALWLGPKTLTGFVSDIKKQQWLLKTINRIESTNPSHKSLIILCLGSIDIRTTIGFLLATKSIDSAEDCIDLIIRSYISINEHFLFELEKFGNRKVAFLSIPPASSSEGIDLKKCSVEQAIKYQKEEPFTIFGTPHERSMWTNVLNHRLKSIAIERGWNFIDNNQTFKLVENPNSGAIDKANTFDGTHITAPSIYLKTVLTAIGAADNFE